METISLSEAGRMLGVSYQTIGKYCDAGLIKCKVFPQGRRRVIKSSLQPFFDSLPEVKPKVEDLESLEVPPLAH